MLDAIPLVKVTVIRSDSSPELEFTADFIRQDLKGDLMIAKLVDQARSDLAAAAESNHFG